jgi:hypothetical protein
LTEFSASRLDHVVLSSNSATTVPAGIRTGNRHRLFHAIGDVVRVDRTATRGILNYDTVAVLRREPDKSHSHDRAERMTSQDVHWPWYLCEDVPSKIIYGQLARTGRVP